MTFRQVHHSYSLPRGYKNWFSSLHTLLTRSLGDGENHSRKSEEHQLYFQVRYNNPNFTKGYTCLVTLFDIW